MDGSPNIYEFNAYDAFFKALAKKRGFSTWLAATIKTTTGYVSQIIKGQKLLSIDQAYTIGSALKFTDAQILYFIKLVEYERAQARTLKETLRKSIERERSAALGFSESRSQAELTTEDLNLFYSNWYYSAIRLLSSIPQHHTIEALTKVTHLPKDVVESVAKFLVDRGLCTLRKGEIHIQTKHTHTDDPVYALKHHQNWRQKALEVLSRSNSKTKLEKSFFFTMPMTISKKDVEKVKALLANAVRETIKIRDPSPPEELVCLNIDYFTLD